jgi:hypothetical protein
MRSTVLILGICVAVCHDDDLMDFGSAGRRQLFPRPLDLKVIGKDGTHDALFDVQPIDDGGAPGEADGLDVDFAVLNYGPSVTVREAAAQAIPDVEPIPAIRIVVNDPRHLCELSALYQA